MNLMQVREQFIKLSGRYDLVTSTSTYADSGADFFITAGAQFLDRRSNLINKTSRLFYQLDAGTWYKTFQKCRIVEDIYINNTTGRSKLTFKDFNWLHKEYSSPISAQDRGTPLYYCPAKLRTDVNDDINNLGAFFNYVTTSSDAYRGVLIFPPPDEAIIIEIVGQFYSSDLTDDEDSNYWTANHPTILILSALYQLETLNHRNTQGANDYLNAIDKLLIDLDKDIVEEEAYTVTAMEG
jgi:hypothetical protein